jgi:DNA mismatch repair protein MutL
LRERVALIWGLTFLRDMVDIDGEHGGFRFHGLIGSPALSRSARSHQFFFLNNRPVVNRSLQYGFAEGYRELLTIGRQPVCVLMVDTHPRMVDVNVHPAKREIRFREERAAREAIRTVVRNRMEVIHDGLVPDGPDENEEVNAPAPPDTSAPVEDVAERPVGEGVTETPVAPPEHAPVTDMPLPLEGGEAPHQTDFVGTQEPEDESLEPEAVYRSVEGGMDELPLQLFDTYLLIPEEDRLLIVDQHALHERLNFDALLEDLEDRDFEAQQLAVPLLVDVPPSHSKLLESNLEVFQKLGIDIEPFGGGTYQVTAICHLYDDSKVPDIIFRILDTLAQGDLFDREDFMTDLFRLATEACRSSVRAGDRLSAEERRSLLDGFRQLRPPYTCPHGRPIITELTQFQMEKSFRRRQ